MNNIKRTRIDSDINNLDCDKQQLKKKTLLQMADDMVRYKI